MKITGNAMNGKEPTDLDDTYSFLKGINQTESKICNVEKGGDFMNLELIEEALSLNLKVKLKSIFLKLTAHKKKGGSMKDFINNVSALDIVNASIENIRFITFLLFKRRLSETVPPLGVTCPKNKRNL